MKYNMWLNPLGAIRTNPTKNTSIDAKLSYVDGMTPMALVVVSTDRRVLQELYNNHNERRLASVREEMLNKWD